MSQQDASIDLLAFGAHPDDAEIGAGGILAKHAAAGFRTAICDLTQAELSSNGTVEVRQKEAKEAGEILGLSTRVCLSFPDRGLTGEEGQLEAIVRVIRRLRPRIVLAPYVKDRHPDHTACNRMVKEAVFNAGIRKKQVDDLPAYRVEHLYYYFINEIDRVDLIVDIGSVYEQKMQALHAYASQFHREAGEVDTILNGPTYLPMIRGRDQLWGHQIGAVYGEGLVAERPLSKPFLL